MTFLLSDRSRQCPPGPEVHLVPLAALSLIRRKDGFRRDDDVTVERSDAKGQWRRTEDEVRRKSDEFLRVSRSNHRREEAAIISRLSEEMRTFSLLL